MYVYDLIETYNFQKYKHKMTFITILTNRLVPINKKTVFSSHVLFIIVNCFKTIIYKLQCTESIWMYVDMVFLQIEMVCENYKSIMNLKAPDDTLNRTQCHNDRFTLKKKTMLYKNTLTAASSPATRCNMVSAT